MKKKTVLLIFAVILFLCCGKNVQAADDLVAEKIKAALEGNKTKTSAIEGVTLEDLIKTGGENVKGRMEVIADVNIRNAEISEVKKGQLKLVFDVENSMDLQSSLIYGLELVKNQGAGKSILSDVKIFSADRITMEKSGSVHREIEYQAPAYLEGDYDLWLKVKDESGLLLALQSFKVNLGGNGKFVEQGNPCYLTIEGEKNIKYNLLQGVDLKKEEKLFLECQTKNLTGENATVLPAIEFYQRDFYGKKTGEYQATQSEAITFGKDEEKLTQIAIPLPENPQAYDAKIVLVKEEKVVSNPIVAHFVVSGKSGTIINASLDKNIYQKGESAQLTVLWAGPADTFLGSRAGGSSLHEPKFEVEFRDKNGMVCSAEGIYAVGDFKTILNITLEKECQYPQVKIKFVDDGQVLYEKNIVTEPEKKEAVLNKQPKSRGQLSLPIVSILFLSLILIIAVLVYRKNKVGKNIIKISIFLLILGASFLMASPSRAATATLYGDPQWIQVRDAYVWGANILPLTVCGLDPVYLPQCPWNYWTTAYCKFSDRLFWYSAWSGIYSCYQDIVSFSYGLSSTSVNQGATITASGSATGVNVCNNGITAGIAVSPRNDSELDWVLSSFCTSADGVTYSGSYSFNTSGWACGYYNSAFYYAFNHQCTSNVVTSYTKIGYGYIGYSVNNCCSQTCATGPGCRSSLTNGSVASGVCCGGTSCFQCNSGFTWNGSMCTANSCSLPWGGSIASGTSVTAYASSSVACGSSCASQTRTCTNGVLSGTYTASACSVSACPLATASVSVSPNPLAYGGSPSFTLSSTNAIYCHVIMDGVWDWQATGYFTSGTYSPGALISPGTHSAWAYCYNADWIGSGWSTTNFTVLPAPTATLSASPTSIAYNAASTLTWSTTNASSCWADWSGWVATSGSVSTGALTANHSYNLTCYNSASVSTGTKTVTISVAAAPTLTFSSFFTSPASPLAYGAATTLTWSTTNTSSCWASGAWSGWKTNTGGSEATGALTANQTYYLECWNSAGFSTGIKTIIVYVATIPAPASINGSSDANGIITLAWTPVTGAVRYLLRIDDQANPWYTAPTDLLNDNVLTTSYTYTGIPGHSYNAWVHACDALSCGASVALPSPIVCPLPTLSFTASPTTVDYNASSTLTWSVTNVSSCWASGAWTGWKSPLGGSESTGPLPTSKAYYLECWNGAVPPTPTGQKSVTVSLNCSPSTSCVEPICGSDFCGKKPYECLSYCGGDCTGVVCSGEKNCGPCNSGTWREVAP